MSHRLQAADPGDVQLHVLDRQQGNSILDRQTRCHFNMSGDEFVRAWRAGEIDAHPDQSAVTYVAMLIPLADDSPSR